MSNTPFKMKGISPLKHPHIRKKVRKSHTHKKKGKKWAEVAGYAAAEVALGALPSKILGKKKVLKSKRKKVGK